MVDVLEAMASAMALTTRYPGAVWPDNFDATEQERFRNLARVADKAQAEARSANMGPRGVRYA